MNPTCLTLTFADVFSDNALEFEKFLIIYSLLKIIRKLVCKWCASRLGC